MIKLASRLTLVAPLLLPALVAACGGGSPDTVPDAKTGSSPDAKVIDPPPPPFVSNTPGATVVDVGTPTTPDLKLLSSNLLQHPSGNQYYQQWLGELQNVGQTTVCIVKLDIGFQGASGTPIAAFTAYVKTVPYDLPGSTVTTSCLAPGDIGTFWTNNFAPAAITLTDIKTIAIKLKPLAPSGETLAANTPTIDSHVVPVFGDSYAVSGTLTGRNAPIYNISIDVFPRDASGLVLEHLIDTDLETLAPQGTFAVDTTSVKASFTQYRFFLQFINGTKKAPAPLPLPADRDLAAAVTDERRLRAEVEARDALARAQQAREQRRW